MHWKQYHNTIVNVTDHLDTIQCCYDDKSGIMTILLTSLII